MKARIIAILILVGILLTAAIGCSAAEGAPKAPKNIHKNLEVTIEEFRQKQNITKTFEMNSGDTLTLTLGSNATTGFKWTEQAQISDKAVLEQTLHEYQEPSATSEQTVMGAAGKEVWVFKALKAGSSQISLDYSRPWEGGEKVEWTFNLTITVK